MEDAPLGTTPPDIMDTEVAVTDQHAEVVAQLGRVASTKNKALQEQAVEAAVELLDVDNLQTVEEGEVTNNFQILSVLPELHKIDPDKTEEIIVEVAVAPQHADNQELLSNLREELAEVRAEQPLMELTKAERELARAEALVEIHSQRVTHFDADQDPLTK